MYIRNSSFLIVATSWKPCKAGPHFKQNNDDDFWIMYKCIQRLPHLRHQSLLLFNTGSPPHFSPLVMPNFSCFQPQTIVCPVLYYYNTTCCILSSRSIVKRKRWLISIHPPRFFTASRLYALRTTYILKSLSDKILCTFGARVGDGKQNCETVTVLSDVRNASIKALLHYSI